MVNMNKAKLVNKKRKFFADTIKTAHMVENKKRSRIFIK
jgi:hypothetical protein